MKKAQFFASMLAFLFFNHCASAQTIVPLNTGFNHSIPSVYSVGQQDRYWINIATSPTPQPPAGPSRVIQSSFPWAAPLPASGPVPGSAWISAWPTIGSQTDPLTKTGYTIFRKCFCMMSFSQARLEFDVRADDDITVWINDIANTILPPSPGHYSSTPIHVLTTNQSFFRIGPNCLYVLLQDKGGYMGFNLRGTMRAFGLFPIPAASIDNSANVSFAPCGCDSSTTGRPNTRAENDDRQVINAIVKFAEARSKLNVSPTKK